MSTCAQACEHDTQSAHDATCSHAAVPVDVSSTAHCWFGTSSGVLHRCSPCPRFSLPKTTSPKGPSQTKIVERVSGRAKTASVARATCPSGRSTRREHCVGTLFFARATRTHAPGGAVRRVSLQRELYRTAPARMPTPRTPFLPTCPLTVHAGSENDFLSIFIFVAQSSRGRAQHRAPGSEGPLPRADGMQARLGALQEQLASAGAGSVLLDLQQQTLQTSRWTRSVQWMRVSAASCPRGSLSELLWAETHKSRATFCREAPMRP